MALDRVLHLLSVRDWIIRLARCLQTDFEVPTKHQNVLVLMGAFRGNRKVYARPQPHFFPILSKYFNRKFLKAATVDAAKYQDVPCFCPKPSKAATTVETVVDLTAEDCTESPEDLKYQEAVDRLKKLQNDLKQQQRRNGLITRTNLKRNTVICISDDEEEEEDGEAERVETSERNIREVISKATELLSKYSNREVSSN